MPNQPKVYGTGRSLKRSRLLETTQKTFKQDFSCLQPTQQNMPGLDDQGADALKRYLIQ